MNIDSERRCQATEAGGGTIALQLSSQPPFDGPGLISFLARRTVAGVEEVSRGTYRRSLPLPHGPATLELEPARDHVLARYRLADPRDLAPAIQRSRALLDLDSDPRAVADALSADPAMARLVRTVPGCRVPGSVDGHELAVRAVLGQQVTLRAASVLAARLVADYGQPLDRPLGSVTHLFPTAGVLAEADLDRTMMPATRRRALVELVAALHRGELVIDGGGDREQARRRLLAVPGIGAWTAGYIAMRAMRDPDVFLAGDVGVRRALTQLGLPASPREAERVAERWRPYRSYALQYLWGSLSPHTAELALAAAA